MLDFKVKEYDEAPDDVINELKRIKKTDTIAIKEIDLNPLNPQIDTDKEIKEFADKLYHSKYGVLETVTVYRQNNGRYMLISGHKRIKACLYNIEHEDELDRSGEVQKTVFAVILEKPDNTADEMNLIMDYNDYRRLETFEKKYKLFLPYYQIVAVMSQNDEFKGRIREYISKRSGLGQKCVGDCIKELENTVLNCLMEFKKELEQGFVKLEDKNEYLKHKTQLPVETLKLVQSKVKNNLEKRKETAEIEETNENIDSDHGDDTLDYQLMDLSDNLSRYLDCKVTVDKKYKITIKCSDVQNLNDILKKIGFDYD